MKGKSSEGEGRKERDEHKWNGRHLFRRQRRKRPKGEKKERVSVGSVVSNSMRLRESDTVSTVSPSISHEVMRPDAMIFVF